jgi:hypothetical protein
MPIKLFKLNATYFFLTLGLSSCTLLDNSVQQILTVDSDSDLTEDGTILPKELAAKYIKEINIASGCEFTQDVIIATFAKYQGGSPSKFLGNVSGIPVSYEHSKYYIYGTYASVKISKYDSSDVEYYATCDIMALKYNPKKIAGALHSLGANKPGIFF